MKKIYLFSMMVLGFVATSVGQSSICSTDPNAQPLVTNYQVFRSDGTYYCVIALTNFPANGQIILYNEGVSVPINAGGVVETDAAGKATFTFDCNANSATDVSVCIGGLGCCSRQVPNAAPLPVKLTAFTGRLQSDNSVILDWTSIVEFNSQKYEVQRSADGLHFESIGDLVAAGSSEYAINYTFNDQLPSAGAYFYRLKQIDIDGKFEYSKVVYVNSKKGAGAVTKVFPNPTKGEIQLIGATSADLQPNNLSIFSISGQRIKYQVIGNAISMDPAAPDGVYIIRLQTAAGLQQFKVVKNQSAKTY